MTKIRQLLLRGAIVNRTKHCEYKYGHVLVLVCTVGPIYYGSP